MNMNDCASSTSTVSCISEKPECLPDIAETTAKLLCETEAILLELMNIIGIVPDENKNARSVNCFRDSLHDLRERAAGVRGLSASLLDNFGR